MYLFHHNLSFTFLICVCEHACIYIGHSPCIEVRGQLESQCLDSAARAFATLAISRALFHDNFMNRMYIRGSSEVLYPRSTSQRIQDPLSLNISLAVLMAFVLDLLLFLCFFVYASTMILVCVSQIIILPLSCVPKQPLVFAGFCFGCCCFVCLFFLFILLFFMHLCKQLPVGARRWCQSPCNFQLPDMGPRNSSYVQEQPKLLSTE